LVQRDSLLQVALVCFADTKQGNLHDFCDFFQK
jgi:hypothetical protein